jgi:DNA-binding transcriptional MerR regulator
MIRIKEFAASFGLSVRTIHHYHHIGLLIPALVDEKEQRWYGAEEERILEQILRYKEMDFALAEIREFIEKGRSDGADLLKQRAILLAKIRRIKHSVARLDELLDKGEGGMNMNKNKEKIIELDEYDRLREEYRREAKELYGASDAFSQSEARTARFGKEDWTQVKDETDRIFMSFKKAMDEGRNEEDAGELVEEWKEFITSNFYDCTLEILTGLAELYVTDERFKKNLEGYGKGLSGYISRAIWSYVSVKE